MSLYHALALLAVPWFLWSTVYSDSPFRERGLRTHPVKEFRSEAECRRALPAYRRETDKAFPPPDWESINDLYSSGLNVKFSYVFVELTCSPVYPR